MRRVDQIVDTEPQKPESDLVESGEDEVKQSARSLQDAADGRDNPVEGLGAMNGVTPAIEEAMRNVPADTVNVPPGPPASDPRDQVYQESLVEEAKTSVEGSRQEDQ